MKKVIIIGCGYGGVVASWRLFSFRKNIEVTVIDKSKYFNYLPLLPDCLGRRIPVESVAYPIQNLSLIYGFNFVNAEVKALDLRQKRVYCSQGELVYDYLIIASGSETNFYGNELFKKYAYRLDCVRDAQQIINVLDKEEFTCFIISGGGYTGVEIATNLRIYLNRKSQNKKRIIIVERANSILGPLPQGIKQCVYKNLKKLNIEIFLNTVIEKIEKRSVYLSNGDSFNDSMLIWTAGVKTADFLQSLAVEKNSQGRVKVDPYLRINDSCSVIGDAAYFLYGNSFLRMAVQFAIAQGSLSVYNIINSLYGFKLKEYKPFDLGYIIPMANNSSCGKILGVYMKGLPPTLFHYFMSIYRAYGLKNKLGIIKALIKDIL